MGAYITTPGGPEDVAVLPRYFTFSLEGRIAPRVMFLIQRGVDPTGLSLSMASPLPSPQSRPEWGVGFPAVAMLPSQSTPFVLNECILGV
eukprot:scaffold40374_cov34-Prasinocladus_malaysianus.AAC.1